MNYPPDQLCKNCKEPFKNHYKEGEPATYPNDNSPWIDNWCKQSIDQHKKKCLYGTFKFRTNGQFGLYRIFS
jgi:hypothetical protein